MSIAELERVLQPSPTLRDIPLCVDLDGTLTYSDTLLEGVVALGGGLALARALLRLPFTGRAAFKQYIAEHAPFDARLLPYNHQLIAYLARQKQDGRYLVLATAA